MTEAVKVVNYTEDQAKDLASRYLAGESVEALATAFGKTARSVIAKLSQLGVYKKAETKEATSKLTKAHLASAVEAKLGLASGSLQSLTKGDKSALEVLFNAVA